MVEGKYFNYTLNTLSLVAIEHVRVRIIMYWHKSFSSALN